MDVVPAQLHVDVLEHGLLALGLVKGLGLHHAGAHRGHLGPVVRAHDGGHQVPAEGRTGHLQVLGVLKGGVVHVDGGGGLQERLVLLHIHVQVGAVRRQAGVQPRRHTGAQVPADVGGPDEEHLRLLVLHQVAQHLGVRVGGVVLEQLVVADVHLVRAVAAQGLGVLLVHAAAQQHAAQLHAQIVGQFFRPSLSSWYPVPRITPSRCSQNTHTPWKAAVSLLL